VENSYVDIDTECLTINGWKKFNELIIGDFVLSYDIIENFLIWDKIKNIKIDNYNGPIIFIDSRRISMISTPSHKMVIEDYNGKIKICESENLKQYDKILTSCKRTANFENIDENLAYLLGIIITDGHIVKYGIGITQNYTKNDDVVDKILNSLNNLKIGYTYSKRKRYYRYNGDKKNKDTLVSVKKIDIYDYTDIQICDVIDIRIGSKYKDIFLKLIPDKKINFNMFNLNLKTLKKIIEGIIDGDGSIRSSKSFAIRGKYEDFHDRTQILSILAGYTADRIFSKNYANYTQLTESTHKLLRNSKDSIIQKGYYDGVMWSPIMEKYNTWIARRNGKMFITAN